MTTDQNSAPGLTNTSPFSNRVESLGDAIQANGLSRNEAGEGSSSTLSDKSTLDLPRLNLQELSDLRTLYYEAQIAEMKFKNQLRLLLVARNLGFDVGIDIQTGQFKVQ